MRLLVEDSYIKQGRWEAQQIHLCAMKALFSGNNARMLLNYQYSRTPSELQVGVGNMYVCVCVCGRARMCVRLFVLKYVRDVTTYSR